jgi:predicted RNA-binding Zn-ribbon protein involved in translation (DUF1610 family)
MDNNEIVEDYLGYCSTCGVVTVFKTSANNNICSHCGNYVDDEENL